MHNIIVQSNDLFAPQLRWTLNSWESLGLTRLTTKSLIQHFNMSRKQLKSCKQSDTRKLSVDRIFLTNQKSPKKSKRIIHPACHTQLLRCNSGAECHTRLNSCLNVAGPSFPELVILPTSRYFMDCQCISPEHHSRLCTLLLLSSTDFHPLIENPPRNWRQQVVEFWKCGSLYTPVKGKQIIVTQKNLPQSPNRQVCSMTLFCALFLQVLIFWPFANSLCKNH